MRFEAMIYSPIGAHSPDIWAVFDNVEREWHYPLGDGFMAARRFAAELNEGDE